MSENIIEEHKKPDHNIVRFLGRHRYIFREKGSAVLPSKVLTNKRVLKHMHEMQTQHPAGVHV